MREMFEGFDPRVELAKRGWTAIIRIDREVNEVIVTETWTKEHADCAVSTAVIVTRGGRPSKVEESDCFVTDMIEFSAIWGRAYEEVE